MGFRFLSTFILAWLGGSTAIAGDCSDAFVDLKGDWGAARFAVDLADDPNERAQGLMFVEKMARNSGMLFVYDAPQHATFWMKNTLIPLDMLFADPTGTITHVHSNAKPLDLTTIDGGQGVKFVLEINGGLAKTFGISEGSVLRHPTIDQEIAAWACESGN